MFETGAEYLVIPSDHGCERDDGIVWGFSEERRQDRSWRLIVLF